MTSSLSATIAEILEKIFGEDKEEFLANPEEYLSEAGLDDLSCADFDDALVSFLENAEFSNDRDGVNLGGTFDNDTDVESRSVSPTEREDGESDHEAIARHLTEVVHQYGDTYITNNNDDRDTYVDNSFQGTVLGDAEFDNDTVVASGDGAVAAGEDIEDSTIVSGDDNVVGDGNQVGDGNFGDGIIDGNVDASGGSAVSIGGDASGFQDNTDNSVRNEDSFNQDNDQDNDTTTTTTTEIDTDIDTDIDNSVSDSGNDNSDNSIDFEDNSDNSTDDDFTDNSDNSVSDSGNIDVDADIDRVVL